MITCPTCQTPSPSDSKFCPRCGTRLEAPRLAEGERKFVSVLFADIVGSTQMGEQLDPEQIAEIMSGAFGFLNAAVQRFGGTVARLMGDAVLALFGAPVAHEDDAERAVLAGLAMQESAREYADSIKRAYGVDFNVRVGIHTGLAVLTMVGDEVKAEYTAMGDTANTAARLQSAAEPGTVLISAETHHLVHNLFDVTTRDPMEMKGKSEPVQAYEVTGRKAIPGKVRGLEGLSSPLVGRDAEFELLRGKVTELSNGTGSFVGVLGEAGLGKSRLLAEVRSWAQDENLKLAWFEGRALSYGQTIAYYPWRQVIRQTIGALENDPPEVVRQKLRQGCDFCSVSEEDVPFLETMLSVESDETLAAASNMHGNELVQHVTEATRRYLQSYAQSVPVVVVFDDLHWADEASLELLISVADLATESSIMIVAVMRADRSAASWPALERARELSGDRYAEVALDPLSANDSQALLGNLLFVEDLPESVRALILRKSEGNPFFLEEVIRSLIDSGHIVQENGNWRATQDIVDVTIPDTLAGVLSARIDRLPEATKRVAQTAAVIGRIFPYPVLMEVCSLAPGRDHIDDPRPHVDALTSEELVREKSRVPELEYIFKHALTQEAAYDALLLRRRKEYHRRVGEVLERLYPDQVDEIAALLAYHFRLGEDWERTANYAMRAGSAAVRVYARREGLEHYDHAYEALKRLPEPEPAQLIDAIVEWAELAAKLRPYDDVIERLTEAEALARQLNDKRRLTRSLVWLGSTHVTRGSPGKGVPALMESYQLAEELGDETLAVAPNFAMTMAMVDRDPRAAIPMAQHVIELSEKYGYPHFAAHATGIKALAYARLGEFEQADKEIQHALQMTEGLDVPVTIADVNVLAAMVNYDLGRIEQGIEYGRIATEQAVAAGAAQCSVAARLHTGVGEIRRPDIPEAKLVIAESIEWTDRADSPYLSGLTRAWMSIARALDGDDGAIADLQRLLSQIQGMGDEYTAAEVSHALAKTYAQLGQVERAEEHLQSIIAYYHQAGMKPYLARALETQAKLREQEGRTSEAGQLHEEAAALTKELTPA